MEKAEEQTQMQVTQIRPIFLNWEEKDRTVVVTPDDNDRFVITVGDAIEACKFKGEEGKFGKQFTLLTRTIAEWLKANKKNISSSYLTIRDAGLLFLVVKKIPQYDDSFEDLLTTLDIKIAQDPQLDLISLSVLAIPNLNEEATSSFLKSGKTLSFRENA